MHTHTYSNKTQQKRSREQWYRRPEWSNGTDALTRPSGVHSWKRNKTYPGKSRNHSKNTRNFIPQKGNYLMNDHNTKTKLEGFFF